MELALLGKILAGGSGAALAIYFLYYIISEVKTMHREGMEKLDKTIDALNKAVTTIAVHSQKLDHGDERMDKIEEEVDLVRNRQHDISQEVHVLKGRQLTQKQVELLIEAKAK